MAPFHRTGESAKAHEIGLGSCEQNRGSYPQHDLDLPPRLGPDATVGTNDGAAPVVVVLPQEAPLLTPGAARALLALVRSCCEGRDRAG
ncbi:hypothetical protein GCM10009608_32310 [Pseudonocardia alaniniphila]